MTKPLVAVYWLQTSRRQQHEENAHSQISKPLIAGVMIKRFVIAIFLAAVMTAGIWYAKSNVYAATITVSTLDDELNTDGDCSLREAVRAANLDQAVDACPAGSGTDTISLAAGEYILSLAGQSEDEALTGDLDISGDLFIVGSGKETTSINGSGLDRVFDIHPGSQVTLEGLTITGGDGGYGGGLNVTNSNLTLFRAEVSGNNGSNGGGLYLDDSTMVIVESDISGNAAHWGGGMATFAPEESNATVLIKKSLISDNTSIDGGGIVNFGPALTLVNSTISGNTLNFSFGNGAGLYNYSYGTAQLYNTTIANNSGGHEGGGIRGNNITVRNSIISGNQTSSSGPDCGGTLTSEGYNLIENATGCTIVGDTTGNITGASADLGQLQDNGGQTMTHGLLNTSPAIDGADPGGCLDEASASLTEDQRGSLRPVDGNGDGVARCDMGAFEGSLNGQAPTPTNTATPSPSPTASPTPTATGTTTPPATNLDNFIYFPAVLR